ncbi:hypothetical protein BJ138DRAFT_1020448, partial [Hygrophoropsis aurantiaca]
RAKALKDRWQEELDLVKAEFIWTSNFFIFKAEQWVARMVVSGDKPGHKAYAARQVNMYRELAMECDSARQSLF